MVTFLNIENKFSECMEKEKKDQAALSKIWVPHKWNVTQANEMWDNKRKMKKNSKVRSRSGQEAIKST